MFGCGGRAWVHGASPGGDPRPSQREAGRAAQDLRHRQGRHHAGGPEDDRQLCQRQVEALPAPPAVPSVYKVVREAS